MSDDDEEDHYGALEINSQGKWTVCMFYPDIQETPSVKIEIGRIPVGVANGAVMDAFIACMKLIAVASIESFHGHRVTGFHDYTDKIKS